MVPGRTIAHLLAIAAVATITSLPVTRCMAFQPRSWHEAHDAGMRARKEHRLGEAEGLFNAAITLAREFAQNDPRLAASYWGLADVLSSQGRFAEAEPLSRWSLVTRERLLGPDHPDVAQSLLTESRILSALERPGEAEPLTRRAVAINEKTQGPRGLKTATALSTLGRVLVQASRYDEALAIDRRVLSIRESAHGSAAPDPDLSAVLVDLATVLIAQNRAQEANSLLDRALEVNERAKGTDDPDRAGTALSLAQALGRQGRYDQAAKVAQESLATFEKSLGPDGLDVADALTVLAANETSQGKLDPARRRLQRALAIIRKTVGPEHPRVVVVLRNLGWVEILSARFNEAYPVVRKGSETLANSRPPGDPEFAESQIQLFLMDTLVRIDQSNDLSAAEANQALRALPGMTKVLERNYRAGDPRIAMMELLHGRLEQSLGRANEARDHYLKGLDVIRSRLGEANGFVVYLLERQCEVDLRLGLAVEVEDLARRVLRARESDSRPDPLKIAACLDFLAMAARMQGKLAEAETLARRSLALRENALGKDHPNVATSLSNLGQVLKEEGKLDEGESVVRRGIVILQGRGRSDDGDLGVSLFLLASISKAKREFARAVPLYERSLAIFERLSGADNRFTMSILDELCETLLEQSKYDQAEATYSRALRVFEHRRGFYVPEVARLRARLAHVMHLNRKDDEAARFYDLAMPLENLAQTVGRRQAASWLEEYASILRSLDRPAEADGIELRARSLRATMSAEPAER
jgi:tetratricopeptide (TPR) repeat protein